MNLKNKYKSLVLLSVFALNTTLVKAETAGDKIDKAVKDSGDAISNSLKNVGAVIAGLISVVTGLVFIVIAFMALWDTFKNNGSNDVFGTHGTKALTALAVAIFAGVIAAAFAFS